MSAADDVLSTLLNSPYSSLLGLEFVEVSAQRVTAALEIQPHHLQPFGVVHGGVYCSAVESVGSVGATMALGGAGVAYGTSNTTDFLRSASGGRLSFEGRPVHVGRTLQLWQVTGIDQDERIICIGRLQVFNKPVGTAAAETAGGA